MKKILFLALMLLSSNLIGQIKQDTLEGITIDEGLNGLKTGKRTIYSQNDTIPIVINLKETKIENEVLWNLNGQVVDKQVIKTIDPNKIEALKIEKESSEFNDANYTGTIYITTKENYKPKLISLNELKAKYLSISKSTYSLFLLDGKVINMDYDKFRIDENYILKIEVQDVENGKENLDIVVISLLTRTKENLKKANTIMIRGSEQYGMNKTSH